MPLKPFVPYALGGLAVVPWALLKVVRVPHGKDGDSLTFGAKFQKALGAGPFFHGSEIGPLDLSIYGTLKCFTHLKSPGAAAVLDDCGLRSWFEKVDEAVEAKGPLLK